MSAQESLRIDTTSWKSFRVRNIFNKVSIKKYSSIPTTEGDVPYISCTCKNNGVVKKVDAEGIKENCITVSTNGSCFECFYHDYPIVPSTDVEVLYSDNLNKYTAMFLCSILKQEQSKYSYGKKPKNDKVWDTIIKLPATSDGQPDWAYMEAYMKKVEKKADEQIDETVTMSMGSKEALKTLSKIDIMDFKGYEDVKPKSAYNIPKLNISEWKPFKIDEVFDCEVCAQLDIHNAIEGDIPYITRSAVNNGLSGYYGNIEKVNKGNCITIGAEGAYAFYQEDDFIAGIKVYALRHKKLNAENALFICTMLNMQVSKYSYSNARILARIKEEKILLPINENGGIDWAYMENYIKSLPYGDRI